MDNQASQTISREELDEDFAEKERRKSDLILEANLLKEQQRHQEYVQVLETRREQWVVRLVPDLTAKASLES